jgi:filamentous hemagglutinin
MAADPEFGNKMENLIPGVKAAVSKAGGRSDPPGWTWHHVPASTAEGRVGVMRLVPTAQHVSGTIFQKILHPGGAGGYSEWAIPAGAPKN